MVKDFFHFLKEYNIAALAMAFVMGVASDSLVKSFVNNIVMPLIDPLTRRGWEESTLNLGPIALKWGAFFSEFLHFLILAFVVFLVAKKMLKMEQAPGKK